VYRYMDKGASTWASGRVEVMIVCAVLRSFLLTARVCASTEGRCAPVPHVSTHSRTCDPLPASCFPRVHAPWVAHKPRVPMPPRGIIVSPSRAPVLLYFGPYCSLPDLLPVHHPRYTWRERNSLPNGPAHPSQVAPGETMTMLCAFGVVLFRWGSGGGGIRKCAKIGLGIVHRCRPLPHRYYLGEGDGEQG
jgi:hypothetical protein